MEETSDFLTSVENGLALFMNVTQRGTFLISRWSRRILKSERRRSTNPATTGCAKAARNCRRAWPSVRMARHSIGRCVVAASVPPRRVRGACSDSYSHTCSNTPIRDSRQDSSVRVGVRVRQTRDSRTCTPARLMRDRQRLRQGLRQRPPHTPTPTYALSLSRRLTDDTMTDCIFLVDTSPALVLFLGRNEENSTQGFLQVALHTNTNKSPINK